MFSPLSDITFQEVKGGESIWQARAADGRECVLAGALLGNEVARIRIARGAQLDEARYQIVDAGNESAATLPYHSWIVARGDEAWGQMRQDEQARSALEPYLRGLACSPDSIRLIRPLAEHERIFGAGERTGSMDKRGQAFPIWNVDPPMNHNTQTRTMYTSIPFYISFQPASGQATGVLIDHTGRIEMDLGLTHKNEASATLQGDSLVAYFFSGPTAADVLRQYTELTGRMPLPPRWAIGNHQSRWSYLSAEQVREVAGKLRAGRHPCDAIWLDIDYMNGFRNFTWNAESFPDPAQLTHELHAQGIHLVTIIDPGTKIDDEYAVYQQGKARGYFCSYADGTPFTGSVWPGACAFPDFSRSEVRTWWGTLYQGLLDAGVDGIWNDMDEPSLTNILIPNEETPIHGTTMSDDVLHRAGGADSTGPDGPPTRHAAFHNAYGMEMARATYDGLRRLRPDARPFVLTRSGTAGMQRYAALWTGDNTSSWEHVALAIPMCLNIGMSGVPFVGVDIGGFWQGGNGELLVRFAQLGALLPFCRNHNAMGNHDQEPWAFGEPHESAYRRAIELRYRLMPYLYTLFHEAASSGAPVMRPLYYHYPQDQEASGCESEFLVGESLLVAPVLEAGTTSRRVYLPEGTWFDYWDGGVYAGARWHDVAVSLERWPVFARGNSILPTGPLMQYTGQQPTDPLTFTCYMHEDGQASYTLYEDDGATFAYARGEHALISIGCRVEQNKPIVQIEEHFDRYHPQRDWYEIVVRTGEQRYQQRVKAGQGSITVQLMNINDQDR